MFKILVSIVGFVIQTLIVAPVRLASAFLAALDTSIFTHDLNLQNIAYGI